MLHAVIMAGGSGTRFWPKSRRNRPKQLLQLFGDATMIQMTQRRIAPLIPPARCWVITGEDQCLAIREQLPELSSHQVIAEPCPRDTAPCVGLAALILAKADPDAVMIVMPADHVITPQDEFLRAVEAAVSAIREDPELLITFGVVPTRPEIGYGYIERGPLAGDPLGIAMHEVVQFREKPNKALAEEFLATGRFVWNAGIFLWRAQTILDALQRHAPALYEGLMRIAPDLGTPKEAETLAREFPLLEKIPIDKAVMEKAAKIRVLEVVYHWNDVGDWRSLQDLESSDPQGNIRQGPVHAVETQNSLIIAEPGRLIATLGVDDLVIIQSGNATLVAKKDALDRLKGLVEGLENAGFGDTL